MQNLDLTPEQLRQANVPVRWTVNALLEKLPHVDPAWMRSALAHGFSGEMSDLEAGIERSIDAQQHPLARLYLELVLLFLGKPRGRTAFLNALRGEDARQRQLALEQLRSFVLGDLGQAGRPGRLAVDIEQLVPALAPLLRSPTDAQAQLALDFMLQGEWFESFRATLRPLLTHTLASVRDRVRRAFLERGLGDGVLDSLSAQLIPAAVAKFHHDEAWRSARRDDCRALLTCVERTQDPAVRDRAGELALKWLLQPSPPSGTASVAPPARSTPYDGWVDDAALLKIVRICRPPEAASALIRLIDATDQPSWRRIDALLACVDVGGRVVPASAETVISQLISEPNIGGYDDRLQRLIQRGLMSMAMLVRATREPSWCFFAARAIEAWPRDAHGGADTRLAVTGLTEVLRQLVDQLPAARQSLNYVLGTLHRLPCEVADEAAIIDCLVGAVRRLRDVEDSSSLTLELKHHLLRFGGSVAGLGGTIDPWDATWAFWQTENWTWADVAERIRLSGAFSSRSPIDTGDPSQDAPRCRSATEFILHWLAVPASPVVCCNIRDNGFDPAHHVLFGKLLAAVQPPVEVQELSQTWDEQWTRLPSVEEGTPVYSREGTTCLVRFLHQNQVKGFLANPGGTWMDVPAVLQGFNDFMADLGRPERAWRLEDSDNWGNEWPLFVCADQQAFPPLIEQLRLPVVPMRDATREAVNLIAQAAAR